MAVYWHGRLGKSSKKSKFSNLQSFSLWDSLAFWTTHTHTHPFNGPLSRTTWVRQYQDGKTNLVFTEAKDSEWQWHQMGHMRVCTSLQTTMPAPHHSVFYRPDALPAAQSTAWKQCRTALKLKQFFVRVSYFLKAGSTKSSQLKGLVEPANFKHIVILHSHCITVILSFYRIVLFCIIL